MQFFIVENLPLMGVDSCKFFLKNGVEKIFCVFPALINVKLCETCFLSKKSCRKKFFQKMKFLPYRGVRT